MTAKLAGLRVATFESRRSEEMASLVRKHGGEPVRAPSMREVPLGDQTEAIAFGEVLLGGGCDVLILLTGVGARMLVDALATRWARASVIAALGRTALVCRGPKPVAALKELGLRPTLAVPEPNTWRDLLAALDASLPIAKRRVFIQEYGARNEELIAGLVARDATVKPVAVYAWTLPEDTGPLEEAIERILARAVDAALFTSGHQVDNLFEVATRRGHAEALRQALGDQVVIASIGPITTEALERHGLRADVEPEHPKMGHLVVALSDRAAEILARKRSR